MKPILYINKNLYLRVCYILKNVLPKMGFSPFSLSIQAGKKGDEIAMLKLFFSENRLPAYCFGLILLFYSGP
jgi:hypothetical protein